MTPTERINRWWLVALTAWLSLLSLPSIKWDGKIVVPWFGPAVVAGPRTFILVHETGDDSAEFSSLKVGLRKDEVAKPLSAKGHTLYIIDKDQAGKYMPKESWPTLPVLVVSDGKATLAVEPIPVVKLADVVKLIEKHGGPLK